MSLIEIRGLNKKYGETMVLSDVNADVDRGETVSIIGESGAGKSTLLRAINYLDPPSTGTVVFDGIEVTRSTCDAIHRRMGMVFQNFGLFGHLTALENVCLAPIKLKRESRTTAQSRGRELLASVGLAHRANAYPTELSGGQKQRVAIARCLAMNPDAILFDEPTSALDPTMVSEVTSVMRNLAKTGITMLIVTHEMNFARDISDRVWYLDEGRIYEQGPPEQIFTYPQLPKTAAFVYAIHAYRYDVVGRQFDHVEMLSGLDDFSAKYAIDRQLANHLRMLAEELVINIVAPQANSCTLNVVFSEKRDLCSLEVLYPGPDFNALHTSRNDLALTLARGSANEITHRYCNGINTLTGRVRL